MGVKVPKGQTKCALDASGQVSAAEGQTVNMSDAGTIVFGTQLSSGNDTWSITSYQPKYSP